MGCWYKIFNHVKFKMAGLPRNSEFRPIIAKLKHQARLKTKSYKEQNKAARKKRIEEMTKMGRNSSLESSFSGKRWREVEFEKAKQQVLQAANDGQTEFVIPDYGDHNRARFTRNALKLLFPKEYRSALVKRKALRKVMIEASKMGLNGENTMDSKIFEAKLVLSNNKDIPNLQTK